jgi:transcriptional regulator with XRE-family HTH domain
MHYSRDALGQTIAELREAKGLTQQELGDLAGYRAGAAVSISRVESGRVLPGEERRADIAAALGLTLADLESAATERTRQIAVGTAPAGRAATSAARTEDLMERATRLDQEVRRRDALHRQVIEAFTDAYDRSLNQFFLPLVDISSGIGNIDQPPDPPQHSEPTTGAEAEAASRFRLARKGVATVAASGAQFIAMGSSKEVGHLAAYGALQAVVAHGKASTGTPIAELHGAPRLRTAKSRLGGGPIAKGGGGIASGEKRLNGIVTGVEWGLPVLVTVIAETRRAMKELRLNAELEEFEASLKATRRGYEAIAEILPRATAVLDDIAVHGTRALNRWAAQLGPLPWGSLAPTDEQRYQEFIELSTCQIVAGAINIQDLLERTGRHQEDLIAAIDEGVNRAQATVAKLV